MILTHKIISEITTGEPEWGVDVEGERQREREQQINRVRDGALERNRSGVGQKWLLEKLNT